MTIKDLYIITHRISIFLADILADLAYEVYYPKKAALELVRLESLKCALAMRHDYGHGYVTGSTLRGQNGSMFSELVAPALDRGTPP